jgi:hypothetical protein
LFIFLRFLTVVQNSVAIDSNVSHSWTIYWTTAASLVSSIDTLMASRLIATSFDQFETKVGFTYCKSAGELHLSATDTRTPNMSRQAIVRNILLLLTL